MAVAVDQGFADRIARIQSGKQWAPDGVVMPKNRKRRRKVDLNRGSRRMTFLLSLVLIGGIWTAFASQAPELAGQILAGGSSVVNAALETATGG